MCAHIFARPFGGSESGKKWEESQWLSYPLLSCKKADVVSWGLTAVKL